MNILRFLEDFETARSVFVDRLSRFVRAREVCVHLIADTCVLCMREECVFVL